MTADLSSDFIALWHETSGDSFFDRMRRQSLEAMAVQDPDLASTLALLKRSGQAEVDLHLDGENVHGHAANAAAVGLFVKAIDKLVKEVVKSSSKVRVPRDLLLFSPEPGSLRLKFTAPPAVVEAESEIAIGALPEETLESQGLEQAAQLLALAEDSSAEMDTIIEPLPLSVRAALKQTVKVIAGERWEISGNVSGRNGQQQLSFRYEGAQRMLTELERKQEKRESVVLSGEIDGQRMSTGKMWFAPDHGKPFGARVPEVSLLLELRKLAAEGNRIVATFERLDTIPIGTSTTVSSEYLLKSVAPSPQTPSLF